MEEFGVGGPGEVQSDSEGVAPLHRGKLAGVRGVGGPAGGPHGDRARRASVQRHDGAQDLDHFRPARGVEVHDPASPDPPHHRRQYIRGQERPYVCVADLEIGMKRR